jgi:sulfide:quinone oxidoreductase
VIGVCAAPFKCPPAPSECALLLDEELRSRGVREACRISFVIPLPTPVPPSPEASEALEAEFTKRGIELIPGRRISALDPSEVSLCSTTAASFPSTSSSACRSTARPRW